MYMLLHIIPRVRRHRCRHAPWLLLSISEMSGLSGVSPITPPALDLLARSDDFNRRNSPCRRDNLTVRFPFSIFTYCAIWASIKSAPMFIHAYPFRCTIHTCTYTQIVAIAYYASTLLCIFQERLTGLGTGQLPTIIQLWSRPSTSSEQTLHFWVLTTFLSPCWQKEKNTRTQL